MEPETLPDTHAARLAMLTPAKDRGDGSPSAEAREQARQIRKQRNARVEAWRDVVAASASDCTCTASSPPSSCIGSTASWGPGASNATTGELAGVQEPVETPATTISAGKQDGFYFTSPACHQCSRLGAPSFMGEKEVDDVAEIIQPRRTSSISRMLKQLTARIGLGTERRVSDTKASTNTATAPQERAASASRSVIPSTIRTSKPQQAADRPASRDSFAESRKTKMKQIHRDRQRQEQQNSGRKRSMFGGKLSLDLNRVNEALIMQAPADPPENLTYKRPGLNNATSSLAPLSMESKGNNARKVKHTEESVSSSSNDEDATADPLVTHRHKQNARGMERMARAQQLLSRVRDMGNPGSDDVPSTRPQATNKGVTMARNAPPVQAPA